MITPTRNDVFTVTRPVVEQAFEDEMIILDLERDLYFSLNDVGRILWTQIAAGVSFEAMLAHLDTCFDAPATTLRQDTLEFLQQLLDAGLIQHQRVSQPC